MERREKLCILLFIVAEAALYFSYLYIDFFWPQYYGASAILKYCGILLCVCFAVYQLFLYPSILKEPAIIVGICLTFVADYYLVFTDNVVMGIVIFILAHIAYGKMLMGQERLLKYCGGMLVAGTIFYFMFCANYSQEVGVIFSMGIVYSCFLIHNLYLASKKKDAILTLAFALLLLGDLHVGIFNIPRYLSITSPIILSWIGFAGYGMWLFYLPSQICMALGLVPNRQV